MSAATKSTDLDLDLDNKVKLPNGDKYHKHVVFVSFNNATRAEIKWSATQDASFLCEFGDVLTTTDETIVHEGIAPKGGSLWLVCDDTCTTVKHYAYDRRQLRVAD